MHGGDVLGRKEEKRRERTSLFLHPPPFSLFSIHWSSVPIQHEPGLGSSRYAREKDKTRLTYQSSLSMSWEGLHI